MQGKVRILFNAREGDWKALQVDSEQAKQAARHPGRCRRTPKSLSSRSAVSVFLLLSYPLLTLLWTTASTPNLNQGQIGKQSSSDHWPGLCNPMQHCEYKAPKKGFEREHSLVFLFRVTLQCHYLVSLSGVALWCHSLTSMSSVILVTSIALILFL